MLCLLIELEFNLALGSDHKLVYLGSDEMFSFGDFGCWTSQLVLAWNKKQTVSQRTFSLVTPTFALISNKNVTRNFSILYS